MCDWLDKKNQELAKMWIFFRHQKNNPEGEFSSICYFADGYDEKNNIWFEYDEPHHEYSHIKKKDEIREKRLIGKLKCRFIRYSEKKDQLYEKFKEQNIYCNILDGSDSIEKRQNIMNEVETGACKIILCSQIFDEGVDMPILSALILCSSGKSSVKTLQRIGRILRKYKDKDIAAVIEFDDKVKYLKEHSLARKKIYKREDFEVIEWKNV